MIQWLFHYGPRCRAHYSEPKCVGFTFFCDSSAYWFSPRRSRLHTTSPPRHGPTAVSCVCALLQKYAAKTCSSNGYYGTLHYHYNFEVRDSGFRRPLSADWRLPSQPAACWSRPVRHPSRRRPPVRDVRSATSASPAASDARVSCPSYKTSFLRSYNFFSFF